MAEKLAIPDPINLLSAGVANKIKQWPEELLLCNIMKVWLEVDVYSSHWREQKACVVIKRGSHVR